MTRIISFRLAILLSLAFVRGSALAEEPDPILRSIQQPIDNPSQGSDKDYDFVTPITTTVCRVCLPDKEENDFVTNKCAYVSIPLGGAAAPAVGRLAARLTFLEDAPSEMTYTPFALRFTYDYWLPHFWQVTSTGAPRQVYMRDPTGSLSWFIFEENESVARAHGRDAVRHYQLKMLGANGNPTTDAPTFYDLIPGDGTRWRFSALKTVEEFGRLIHIELENGVTVTPQNGGYEVLRGLEGEIRQVRSVSRLANIVPHGDHGFRINVYADADVGPKDPQTGYYSVVADPEPAEPMAQYTFEDPDPPAGEKLRVTVNRNGASRYHEFTYSVEKHDWVLDSTVEVANGEPAFDGPRQQKEITWNLERTRVEIVERWDPPKGTQNPTPLGERLQVMESIDGEILTTSRIQDPNGLALTTTMAYYTNAQEPHRYRRMRYQIKPDGNWTAWDYDQQGLISLELRPWQDSPADPADASANNCDVTEFAYTPLDNNDTLETNDRRPRTTIRKVLGNEVSRSYRVYASNPTTGAHYEIDEEAPPGVAYGNAANRRTARYSYGPNDGALLDGRLRRVEHSGGQVEEYDHEVGNWTVPQDLWTSGFTADANGKALRTTVTRLGAGQQNPTAGSSTRSASILDKFGKHVRSETWVWNGSAWEIIAWEQTAYDRYGFETERRRSDGTLVTSLRRSHCCGADEIVEADGVYRKTEFDALHRKLAERKIGDPQDEGTDVIRAWTYDIAGRRLTETLRDGANSVSLTTQWAYDGAGRATNEWNSALLQTKTVYSADGRTVTRIAPDTGTVITSTYLDGRPKSSTGTATIHRCYQYGADELNGVRTQWATIYTGPDGVDSPMWEKTWTDAFGRVVRVERPEYDVGQNRDSLVTTNTYNATTGYLVKIESTGQPTQRFEYDVFGERIRSAIDLDPSDDLNNTNNTIDLATDRVTETATEYVKVDGVWYRQMRQSVYPTDNSNTPKQIAVQQEQLTGLGGEANDGTLIAQTISIDVLENQTVRRTYVDRENRTRVEITDLPATDENHNAEEHFRNGLHVASKSATGVERTRDHDEIERLKLETDPRTAAQGDTVYAYYTSGAGRKGQLSTITTPGNRVTSYDYDSISGRRTQVTDALNQTTHTAYDKHGRVVAVWGATYPVAYEFDGNGRMIGMYTLRDHDGQIAIEDYEDITGNLASFDKTTWVYDEPTGLLIRKRYPIAAPDTVSRGPDYTYTAGGRLLTRTWARGVTTTYDYDGAGQLTSVNYSDNTPDVSFTYDRLGRQATVTDTMGQRTLAYDANTLQLQSETLSGSHVLNRTYDSLARPLGLSLSNQSYAVTNAYDQTTGTGRLASITAILSGGNRTVNYNYAANSDLIGNYTVGDLSRTVTWEATRDMVDVVTNTWQTGNLSRFDYANDDAGRRTGRDDSGTAFASTQNNTFGYNARSEVANATMRNGNSTYTFDAIGNRIAVSLPGESHPPVHYTVNQLNQYTEIKDDEDPPTYVRSPEYDDDGNMEDTGSGIVMTWDGENRLIQTVKNSQTVTYAYDYMSRRVSKTVGNTTWKYIYDGWNLIREEKVVNETPVFTYFVWGLDLSQTFQGAGGVGGLLLVSTGETVHAPTFDANGNISEYVRLSDGNVTAHLEYDAFGRVIASTGTAPAAFGFSTKYTDSETGLVYYGYRYYSPELGRWPNRDPIGEQGGHNHYGYTGNDSLSKFDHLGLLEQVTGNVTASWYEVDYMVGNALQGALNAIFVPPALQGNMIRGFRISGKKELNKGNNVIMAKKCTSVFILVEVAPTSNTTFPKYDEYNPYQDPVPLIYPIVSSQASSMGRQRGFHSNIHGGTYRSIPYISYPHGALWIWVRPGSALESWNVFTASGIDLLTVKPETYGLTTAHHFAYGELIPWDNIKKGVPDYKLWVDMVDETGDGLKVRPFYELSVKIGAQDK